MKQIALLTGLFLLIAPMAQAKDYTPSECPVVGNANSYIYHVPGGRSYAKMLRENHSGDNRKCFKTEQAAEKAGFRRSKR